MDKKIKLTSEELEEIKDEIRFRTKVTLQLKELNEILNDMPEKVAVLGVKVKIYGIIVGIMLTGMFGLALAYFRR